MSHGIKTFLSITAIILTTLCGLKTPAHAQFIFNPLQNLGGGITTAPSCTGASGSTFCGAVGVNGHLFLNQYIDLNSVGYTDLGGVVIGRPSCTHFGITNQSFFRVLCGVIGTDSALWVNRFDGVSPSGFTSLGGISISDPACTGISGSTKAVCVVIGTNSHLFASTTLDGISWTAFADLDLGGTLIFNPTCMDIGDMMGFCGAVTTDGELRLLRFRAGGGPVSWDTSANIITFPPLILQTLGNARLVTGGISIPNTLRITSDPSCAAGLRAAVVCGVRGSDSALYISQFNGTTFSPFQFEGGTLASAPSCAYAICAARGADSQLYIIQFLSNGITTAFTPVPGANMNGDPSCTLHPNELLTLLMLCGVRKTDSTLWVTIGHE